MVIEIKISDFKNKKVIFFSPHHDDCCFSSAGFIQCLKELDIKVTLINVFSKSAYSYKKIDEDISETRKKEDERFCNAIDIASYNLGFDDSSKRGYDDNSEIVTYDYKDSIEDLVIKASISLIDKINADYIILPIGVGNHVDHIVVRNICDKISNRNILFYEDLPYANKFTLHEIEEVAKVCGVANKVKIKINIKNKIYMCNLYESQVEEDTVDKIIKHSNKFAIYGNFEQLWYK